MIHTLFFLLLCLAASARDYRVPVPPIVDDPKLPRVLLIGDSISIGYVLPVRKLLAGRANVHRIPGLGRKADFRHHQARSGGQGEPGSNSADVEIYNKAALEVMLESSSPIDDLSELVLPKLSEWQQPVNVRFSSKGSEQIAEAAASSIRGRL